MLLSPDNVQALARALLRALECAEVTERQLQRFYDMRESAPEELKPCPTPRLSPNMELDLLNLNGCLGATLNVDFDVFCHVYETFVEDCIGKNSKTFNRPWKFFAETLGISVGESEFYFRSHKAGKDYNRKTHMTKILMVLAQFAIKNYGGVVAIQNAGIFKVEAGGRAFGISLGVPLSEIKGLPKLRLGGRYGLTTLWRPYIRPKEKGQVRSADCAYYVVSNLTLPGEVKRPILEGISLLRWMGAKDTIYQILSGRDLDLDSDLSEQISAQATVEEKLRGIEYATQFEEFRDVSFQMRQAIVPTVISYQEYRELFGKPVKRIIDVTYPRRARWKEKLNELHRSVANAN